MSALFLPEPKIVRLEGDFSKEFSKFYVVAVDTGELDLREIEELTRLRFWDYPELLDGSDTDAVMKLEFVRALPERDVEKPDLFAQQGYVLQIGEDFVRLLFEHRDGLVNGLSSIRTMIAKENARNGFQSQTYQLPIGEIVDYPSIAVRAVAATFSWYAGYGRMGFDMQLWGYEEWVEYLNHLLDAKLNQINLCLYGYWPFEFPEYPETVYKDVGLEIWNAENERFLKVKFSHPNVEDNFLPDFIALAHKLGVNVFAYVGLNSYNGARSIVMPETRMKPPTGSDFLNDFDSLCLSDPENIEYILASMKRIAELGFDGFALEESEEGFWFCECEECRRTWHEKSDSPGEAKHLANMWLLRKIYDTVRAVNPEAVVGIRAFRQPPLEKSQEFLSETVASIPDDVVLFWAPALYVPETEFPKWVQAFGKDRIWGRDSESNSITSTMGRLYRTFESNMLRYEDEANVQTIERDIEQHITSVEADVHGINGYMFEWYGLFMHQWAHGNYGWGSKINRDEFFESAAKQVFGDLLGSQVLNILKSILTIHESQIPLYTTPFPFQSNKVNEQDVPAIAAAMANHDELLGETYYIEKLTRSIPKLRTWSPHFARLINAQRRNAVIYKMALAALEYERTDDPVRRDQLLDEILAYNEEDFSIAKEMFFDLNPVSGSGVKSSMMPYHELKRLIHNLKHPEDPDDDVICSGIEALGWLWLSNKEEAESNDD